MKRAGIICSILPGRESLLADKLPSVKDQIRADLIKLGILKGGIFERDNTLFFYFENEDKNNRTAIEVIQEKLGESLENNKVILDEVFYTQGFQEDKMTYMRVATFMKVKPGFEEAYRCAHANIWPSILEGIQRTKIRNYTIFMKGTELYSYFEVKDLDHAMAVLADDPENQRWQRTMAPMMDVGSGMKDGSSVYLKEILSF